MICLVSIIDDIYDASRATIEELVLFNEAIQRWEVSSLDQLPDYMKVVYQAVLDAYNMIDEEMAKQGKLYATNYAKSAVKDMTRGYLAEAKWYHEGYVPSFEEYMPTAMLSGGQQALAITFLVGMGELATKEALDWLYTDPLIVQGASVVGRLMDDVVGHEAALDLDAAICKVAHFETSSVVASSAAMVEAEACLNASLKKGSNSCGSLMESILVDLINCCNI
ncbi:hypothetical protein RHSIM_Rhsim06G0194900 [Rhododendron simsii]|uniref:Terpene synthase metal-binding domain-containing protein n=1 Tax=Rhododendron simsii TaxID=118357 RepID=A0A834GTW1_RHOSS|nr:hypothetical protein RHSIM_Rhsim06G0194900 [Rhododendron simsii]